mmetsp:Transcript_37673/g.126016  ORF Transcript_37673/g.126016 Transcript_37673/m.126016 type:complete len:230 (-) Transcript_37673:5-694(-)
MRDASPAHGLPRRWLRRNEVGREEARRAAVRYGRPKLPAVAVRVAREERLSARVAHRVWHLVRLERRLERCEVVQRDGDVAVSPRVDGPALGHVALRRRAHAVLRVHIRRVRVGQLQQLDRLLAHAHARCARATRAESLTRLGIVRHAEYARVESPRRGCITDEYRHVGDATILHCRRTRRLAEARRRLQTDAAVAERACAARPGAEIASVRRRRVRGGHQCVPHKSSE